MFRFISTSSTTSSITMSDLQLWLCQPWLQWLQWLQCGYRKSWGRWWRNGRLWLRLTRLTCFKAIYYASSIEWSLKNKSLAGASPTLWICRLSSLRKLRLTNKARTPCFCSLQRSGFYVRRFQLLPLKVSECCGAVCGRPPGATAQSSSYQKNQQQERRLGVRCTKTELRISSPSPKWVRCMTKPSAWWQDSMRCCSGQALDCLDLWEAALVCRCTEELWCSSKDHR